MESNGTLPKNEPAPKAPRINKAEQASDEFAQFLAVAASKLDVNIATVETWLRTYKLKTTLRLLMKGTAQ